MCRDTRLPKNREKNKTTDGSKKHTNPSPPGLFIKMSYSLVVI